MSLYFAYGSNTDQKQMETRCGHLPKIVGKVCLKGYCLMFPRYSRNRKGGVADIWKADDPNEAVWGILYDLSKEDRDKLDIEEGYPNVYTRIQLDLESNGQIYSGVWVYTVKDKPKKITFYHPSEEYIDTLIRGAEQNGLPSEWIAKLQRIRRGTLGNNAK